jgi:hypothetical protein
MRGQGVFCEKNELSLLSSWTDTGIVNHWHLKREDIAFKLSPARARGIHFTSGLDQCGEIAYQ